MVLMLNDAPAHLALDFGGQSAFAVKALDGRLLQ